VRKEEENNTVIHIILYIPIMTRRIVLILLVALVALSFAPKVAAFGAGNIPSYSHLEDRAFRHGDIEDIIEKRMSPTCRSKLINSVQGCWGWIFI
jgi:hypothetical protein